MQYLTLFPETANPVTASQIALGCDHYGGRRPEDLARRIMDTYFELGGTVFDTAHVYSQERPGEVSGSERVVGQWIADNGVRDRVVLVTKGVHPDRSDMLTSRITRDNIRDDLAASLETLAVDHVDVWFLHRDNPAMPVGEIVDMVTELVDEGRVRHVGASNWTAERIAAANQYARQHHRRPFEIAQIQWSFTVSTPESWEDPTVVCMNDREYAWYAAEKFPLMVFSPQARGVVAKMLAGGKEAVPENWARRFMLEENRDRIERCRQLGERTGRNPAGICLSYLTSAPFPVLPVIGCSSPEQVRDSLRFSDEVLSEEERAFLVTDD
ncbi:MAG: aldo/keto reductase [Planctomycetes bacterium]|nr:aldo/keto reductase [Planctomycetota bacterium]